MERRAARGQQREAGVDLHVPSERGHAGGDALHLCGSACCIAFLVDLQVDPCPAHASGAQDLEFRVGHTIVDHGHASRAVWTPHAQRMQRCRIVEPVDAGLDDDDALDAEPGMQLRQRLDGRRRRGVLARSRERELPLVEEDMRMAVAGARGGIAGWR